jgi:hypothetical protein
MCHILKHLNFVHPVIQPYLAYFIKAQILTPDSEEFNYSNGQVNAVSWCLNAAHSLMIKLKCNSVEEIACHC